MEDSLQFDYMFKYILVGDSSVGKSSVLSAFLNNIRPTSHKINWLLDSCNPTMGVEFATKKVSVNGHIIKLQIWDTAGQESFRTITRAYYKNSIGVILVYDLTCPKSVESLESWVAEIQDNSNEKAEIVLAGNKMDLFDSLPLTQKNRVMAGKGATVRDLILPSRISQFKRYITSAKTGLNVNEMFTELTGSILAKILNKQIDPEGIQGVKKGNSPSGAIKSLRTEMEDREHRGCCG